MHPIKELLLKKDEMQLMLALLSSQWLYWNVFGVLFLCLKEGVRIGA